MNQRSVAFAWLASILLLTVFAGVSWLNLELTPEAGGQAIELTGYLVFPVISALILLQAAALLVTFLTPVLVGRVIAAVLVPVMVIHATYVVVSLQSAVQNAVAVQVAEITGVVGFTSQEQFVAFALDTYMWVAYLLAVAVNVAVLLAKAVLKLSPAVSRTPQDLASDADDLWEAQK